MLIVRLKNGFKTVSEALENIERIDIGDFDEQNMALHGVNRNLQRNIALFYDNLKVVHRRVLFAMATMGLFAHKDGGVSKTAGVIGRTIEKFHPHSDAAAYETLIYMGQPWRNLMTLTKIKGNYGNAEAPGTYGQMRYTDCSLSEFAYDCFFSEWDLKPGPVDMRMTFSGKDMEPLYMPAKYPLFLMMWGSGMGYGLATDSPGFLPQEAFQLIIDLIKDPKAKILLYPEDPLGCTIIGKEAFRKFVDYDFERDTNDDGLRYRVRANYETEIISGKNIIRIVNTPFEVNPNTVIERIKKLKAENKIEGLENIETKLRKGHSEIMGNKEDNVDILLIYKKGYDPHIIMEKLYKQTQLESTFSLNCVYVDMNKNVRFNLRDSALAWIKTRKKVLKRSYRMELNTKSKRVYVLDALIKLFDGGHINNVIDIVRLNKRKDVPEILINKFKISDYQARKITDMKISDLSPEAYDDYIKERKKCLDRIDELQEILKRKKNLDKIIINQMKEGIKKYSRERQSEVIEAASEDDNSVSDIEVTGNGLIRRTEVGQDVTFTDDDSIELISRHREVSSNNKVLMFTNNGVLFTEDVSKIRFSQESSIGSPISNKFDSNKQRIVSTIMVKPSSSGNLVFITKNGLVKCSKLSDYFVASQASSAIKLGKGDELVAVFEITAKELKSDRVFLYTKQGSCSLFPAADISVTARATIGSMGIKVDDDDEVIGGGVAKASDDHMITISDSGHVKKFHIDTTFGSGKSKATNGVSVSSDGKLHMLIAVSNKITSITFEAMQYTETLELADVPIKTRISSGDKLVRARRKKEIITKNK